ncbi:MAG: transglutaminase domain-containing protein, partial [Gemmatimonadota bacterium]
DPGQTWWALYDRGDRSGYQWRRVDPGGRSWEEASAGWRSGFARTHTAVTADSALRPLAYRHEHREGLQVLVRRAHLAGDTLYWSDALGDQVESGALRLPAGAILGEGLHPPSRGGSPEPGWCDTALVIDLEALTARPVAAALEADPAAGAPSGPGFLLRLRPGAPVPMEVLSGRSPTADVEAGELLAGLEVLEWLDAAGQPVRSAVPALGLEQVRVSALEARSWETPRHAAPIRLDHPVAQPTRLDCLVVVLPPALGDARRLFPASARQRVEADSSGWRLVVQRVAVDDEVPTALPATGPALEPYLLPDLYAPSGHPRLRELADRVLAGCDAGPEAAARRLQAWVYDHLRPADTEVHFRSALEVLDDLEGTCSEYAVLLVALCRAAAIPARVAVGLAVSPSGELVLHMWAQLYLHGAWVDVDPSWNAFPAGADLLETGHGRLTPAAIIRMNLPLQYILARADTLELAAYRRGALRYSGQAESLWEAAQEADRHFEAERAHELCHQIALLPWNQRSGEAYLQIGQYRQRRAQPEEARWAYERLLRLAPHDPQADGALLYLARLAEEAGDLTRAEAVLESLVVEYPDGDRADDALGRLAELRQRAHGCAAARPYYERVREAYPESGWARVAAVALGRCDRDEAGPQP